MIKTIIILALSSYATVMFAIFFLQRRLMYHPVPTPGIGNLPNAPTARLIALTTQDKTSIAAWHIAASDGSLPLLVYFHGNAGHIGDRMQKLLHYVGKGFGVLAVSYRGYGASTGKPSEAGLYDDAITTVRNAIDVLGYPPARLLLVGESLGTGVATHVAKTLADAGTPVSGLVLEAPYTSVARRSQELYPYIPAFYLVRDKYDSVRKITSIHCPLLILHGEADAVIPISHGKALLAAASEPKRGVFYPGVGHTDFDPSALANEIVEFVGQNTIRSAAEN